MPLIQFVINCLGKLDLGCLWMPNTNNLTPQRIDRASYPISSPPVSLGFFALRLRSSVCFYGTQIHSCHFHKIK